MNIALICDSNYLIPTKTLINSIIHNCQNNNIVVHVIGVHMNIEQIKPISALETESVKIKITLPGTMFNDINVQHIHVSKAALYKMILPSLLPDIDKVLYLDVDMLVLSRLNDLYNIDLKDCYAAVVRDMIAEEDLKLNLKISVEKYFNSGMMLLNLKKMREDNISNELIISRIKDTSNAFMDQDSFNRVLNKRIITVSPTYNYMQTMGQRYTRGKIASYYGLTVKEVVKIKNNPVILHFTGNLKPWNHIDIDNAGMWFQYMIKEDAIPIIERIGQNVKTVREELAGTRKQLNVLQAQNEQNMKFAEKGILFEYDHFTVFEKKMYECKEEIVKAIEIQAGKYSIVIFGAGKMGQMLFKFLCESGMSDNILGFAVSNETDNLFKLYGKKVQELSKYCNINVCILYAVKSGSIENVLQIKESGFRNVVNINELLR